MKRVLFDALAFLGEAIIDLLENVGDLLSLGIESLFGFFVWLAANAFKAILWVVDSDRLDHAEQVADQYSMNQELEILGAISHVKEDALQKKAWTSQHSEAINILGNKLCHECDWEEERIHDYMRRVIESIPGLGYLVGSEEDDDDTISIGS
jgi:hypothetical protein